VRRAIAFSGEPSLFRLSRATPIEKTYMTWFTKAFGTNWKTNTAAAVVFVLSCPAFVGALADWAHHQSADWRGALAGVVIAVGLAAAKDNSTHSTTSEVESATTKAKEKGVVDL
jgi:uncharacterized protein (DUF697 family)